MSHTDVFNESLPPLQRFKPNYACMMYSLFPTDTFLWANRCTHAPCFIQCGFCNYNQCNFAVWKPNFVSLYPPEVCLKLDQPFDVLSWNETFIFLSFWNYCTVTGLNVQRKNVFYIILICGDG